MVYLCNSVAAASPLVTSEIIDTAAFPELVEQHKIARLPTVLINDSVAVVDVVPAAELFAKILAQQPPAPVSPGT